MHKHYRSEEVLDLDTSDEDDSSDHCSDCDEAAESDDEGSVILAVIETDNSRVVQDLEHSGERYLKAMKRCLADLQVHTAPIASADPIPPAVPDPIPTAAPDPIPTTAPEPYGSQVLFF